DVPATVRWVEQFDDGAPWSRRYEAEATLDNSQRAALGLTQLAPYVQGPVSLSLVLQEPASGATEITLEAGLTRAALSVPQLRWQKAAGGEARARIDLRAEKDGTVRVQELDVRAPELTARGSLVLDRERRLAGMELRQFALRRTSLSADATTRADGRLL